MKDIGRSMAAKRQPRTPDGRFASVKTYVVMDEWGNVSPYEPKEETFGYTTAVTRNPKKMQELARENRRLHGKKEEVKASRDTSCHKIRMAVKIRHADIESKAYYVDKKNPPKGWGRVYKRAGDSKKSGATKRNAVRGDLLEDAMGRTVKSLHGDIKVVVDNHDGLTNPELERMGKRLSKNGRRVEVRMYRSQDKGPYSDMLQTNDYITNAAYGYTKGYVLRAACMRIAFHRYDKDENIKKKGRIEKNKCKHKKRSDSSGGQAPAVTWNYHFKTQIQ